MAGKKASEKGKTIRTKLREGTAKPLGRPRTTVEDLPANWQNIMRAEAQSGGGITGIMVKLGIHNHALITLLEDSEIFRTVYEECMLLCQYWWENRGKDMVTGAQGNAAVWSMNMTNRFNWRSGRNEVVGDPKSPMSHSVEVSKKELSQDELMAELAARGLPTDIFNDK